MIRLKLGILILFIPVVMILSCTPQFRWKDLQNQIDAINAGRLDLTLPEPYRDFAGTIHVHTQLSHDSKGTLEEIVDASRNASSTFVITTDHHGPKVYQRGFQGWFGEVLVIRGSEIIKGCKGMTGAGCNSLLVLGVDEYIEDRGLNMHQVIDKVKELGGLAFAAHPAGYVDWDAAIDGMEIYDILDDAVDRKWKYPKWAFDVMYSYGRYRDQVFLSILDPPHQGVKKWDELTQTRRIVAIAGNDAHQNIRYFGKLIDPYDLTLLFVRTHILASTLNKEEVLGALATGHAYVSFDALADATGFGFWAEDGRIVGMMGDDVSMTPGLTLKVQTPVLGRIQVFRDGKPFHQAMVQQITLPVEDQGVYRVEVSLKIRGRWWPWIYSNPIYIREKDP